MRCFPAVAAALLLASSAMAGGAALDFRGAPGCPDAAAFARSVARHGVVLASDGPAIAGVRVAVELARGELDARGRVRRIAAGVESDTREVTGATCGEVADALALIVAVSLDPERAAEPPPAAPARWAVGVAVGAVGLVPPSPLPAAALFVERRAAGDGSRVRDVRLSLDHARTDGRAARFTRTALGVDVCPIGGDVFGLIARLCGQAAAGVVDAAGVEVAHPLRRRSWWAEAGGRGGLSLVTGRFSFELEAGVALPFRRTEYRFEMPRLVVGRIPPAVWRGGVSAAVQFP